MLRYSEASGHEREGLTDFGQILRSTQDDMAAACERPHNLVRPARHGAGRAIALFETAAANLIDALDYGTNDDAKEPS
jgi:hypothetical protein